MKVTNLAIHLLNGWLVFLLTRVLILSADRSSSKASANSASLLVAFAWLVLPINLTSVLYVVQRMESMANVFVLLGLIGYVRTRERLLDNEGDWRSTALCALCLIVPTAIGVLAKETAIMLPLYAALVEVIIFRFRSANGRLDRRLLGLFMAVLVLPMAIGLAWLVPSLLKPESWATRDFTMGTRLLTEMRVVVDYIAWTLVPLPHALSFYHDDYVVSSGLLSPWTTATSLCTLGALGGAAWWLRLRKPLATLGILLFLGCHLLTATILPLELVYEHRNYFASYGLLLALAALLPLRRSEGSTISHRASHVLAAALLLWWTGLTATTAYAWGEPLRLAQTLAERDPNSPRAQYELGRTYIIYSHNDPQSPYTRLAYAPLERAAALPASSILPQQALIFMNSRMGLPLKDEWWDSMIAKLTSRRPGVQDESSMASLAQCAERNQCPLPQERMRSMFEAALTHTPPSPRLLATYADYAWNVMGNRSLGMSLQTQAVGTSPHEAAYLVTLIRMLLAQGDHAQAQERLKQLEQLNLGGHLDEQLGQLRNQLDTPPSLSSGPNSP